MFKWNASQENWLLIDYRKRTIDGLNESFERGDTLFLDIPMRPKDFGLKEVTVQAMTNDVLREFIAREQRSGDNLVSNYKVKLYQRLSMPAATIILVLMAAAIASRKIRGGMGMHLLLGLLGAFSYILLMQFSTTFAIKSDMSPLLSVWIPNMLYSVVTLVLLRFAPK